jgi:hypothetical protein
MLSLKGSTGACALGPALSISLWISLNRISAINGGTALLPPFLAASKYASVCGTGGNLFSWSWT